MMEDLFSVHPACSMWTAQKEKKLMMTQHYLDIFQEMDKADFMKP